jgi:hypothetical protein
MSAAISFILASVSSTWKNVYWTWSKEVLANENSLAQTTMTNRFSQVASADYPNI